MYKITTRTGRTVKTDKPIETYEQAVNEIMRLEAQLHRAGLYEPGYYKIEEVSDNGH